MQGHHRKKANTHKTKKATTNAQKIVMNFSQVLTKKQGKKMSAKKKHMFYQQSLRYANARATALQEHQATKPSHDIDCVVLWCENDHTHRRMRALTSKYAGNSIDNQDSRFECHDELKWCLRSIFWCIPWVRRVHVVVADYQFPSKFVNMLQAGGEGPEFTVVPHSAILPSDALPTFNSQAIEANLHRIPNLAERFVYFNDDMFVGRPLSPAYFFTQDEAGVPVYNLDPSLAPNRSKSRSMTSHARAWCNNSRVLDALFSPMDRPYPSHVASPVLRSCLAELWEDQRLSTALEQTTHSRFRNNMNMYIIGFLVYYGLGTDRGTVRPQQANDTKFYEPSRGKNMAADFSKILAQHPTLFCVNDGCFGKKEQRALTRCMCMLYPLPTPVEPHDMEVRRTDRYSPRRL
jgi:hypothetical protein